MRPPIYLVYEDEGYKNFLPLTYFRPSFELITGTKTLQERIEELYPKSPSYLLCRDYLVETLSERIHRGFGGKGKKPLAKFNQVPPQTGQPLILINGRAILHKRLPTTTTDTVFRNAEEIVALFLATEKLKEKFSKGITYPLSFRFLGEIAKETETKEVKIDVIRYLWDLVNQNANLLIQDLGRPQKNSGWIDKRVVVYGKSSKIFVDRGARVEAGVVLDTKEGPISIGKNSLVRGPSIIDGPCYIGENTLIDGAKIRGGTTIGNYCRIAGEIEESIIMSYTNKHHDGFLGHAYLGEWINIGALTTNSDLKNDYGEVKVFLPSGEINTRSLKVGCFIGDHTKTAIGTLINTGTIIGVVSNVFGGGVVKKFLPSFSWGDSEKFVEHKLDNALKTAKTVMSRRNVSMNQAYEGLFRIVFEIAKIEEKLKI
ncbi:MAG: putative sugar nucleotidyl transferase [Candidatus Edwardsbacteria bacterium]